MPIACLPSFLPVITIISIMAGTSALRTGPVLLAFLIATALVLLVRAVWEPRQLEMTYSRIPADTSRQDMTNQNTKMPVSAGSSLRIALLSDLHAEHFFLDLNQLIQLLVKAKPDLLVFAGDLAGQDSQMDKAVSLLRQVREHPRLAPLPFYAVAGNHDTDAGLSALDASGIRLLNNESVRLHLKGREWQLIGLQDLREGQPDFARALQSVPDLPASQRIILAHNPDTLFMVPEQAARIMLCGHFHGGQIWTPLKIEFLMLRREKLPRMGITRGLYSIQGLFLYISRGLGCVSLPLRLFSKPEIAILDLLNQQDGG